MNVGSLMIAEPFRPIEPILEQIGEFNVALFDTYFDPLDDEFDDDVCPECDDFLDEEGNCPNGCEVDDEILDGDLDEYFDDDLDDVDFFDEEEDDEYRW